MASATTSEVQHGHVEADEEKSACLPSRWAFAVMGLLSVCFTYILRVDINLAIVGMVNHTAVSMLGTHGFVDEGGVTAPVPLTPVDDVVSSTTTTVSPVKLAAGERMTGTVCVPGTLGDLIPTVFIRGQPAFPAGLGNISAAEYDESLPVREEILQNIKSTVLFPRFQSSLIQIVACLIHSKDFVTEILVFHKVQKLL
jgi:hypothetical protein